MRQVGEYSLVNEEKIDRAINGSMGKEGKLMGGLGESYTDEQLLSEYDKLGGLVLKNGLKLKSGTFFNFIKKSPRTEPKETFLIQMDNQPVEVTEEEAIMFETAKQRAEQMKKRKKAGKSFKDEDEEETEEPKVKPAKLKRPKVE